MARWQWKREEAFVWIVFEAQVTQPPFDRQGPCLVAQRCAPTMVFTHWFKLKVAQPSRMTARDFEARMTKEASLRGGVMAAQTHKEITSNLRGA